MPATPPGAPATNEPELPPSPAFQTRASTARPGCPDRAAPVEPAGTRTSQRFPWCTRTPQLAYRRPRPAHSGDPPRHPKDQLPDDDQHRARPPRPLRRAWRSCRQNIRNAPVPLINTAMDLLECRHAHPSTTPNTTRSCGPVSHSIVCPCGSDQVTLHPVSALVSLLCTVTRPNSRPARDHQPCREPAGQHGPPDRQHQRWCARPERWQRLPARGGGESRTRIAHRLLVRGEGGVESGGGW